MVVIAVERHRLVGPQHADQPHRLAQPGETLLVVGPLDAEGAFVEVLARADTEDHALGMERTQRAKGLRDDGRVITKGRRDHGRAERE